MPHREKLSVVSRAPVGASRRQCDALHAPHELSSPGNSAMQGRITPQQRRVIGMQREHDSSMSASRHARAAMNSLLN
jgi:hypothetical protein